MTGSPWFECSTDEESGPINMHRSPDGDDPSNPTDILDRQSLILVLHGALS
jgi:hypothetical protein